MRDSEYILNILKMVVKAAIDLQHKDTKTVYP